MAGQHRREEHRRAWHEFPGLPPRPDPDTGEPFPPHAPAYTGSDQSGSSEPGLASGPFGPPAPPRGKGPPLAWHRDTALSNVFNYFLAAAILAIGIAAISLLRGDAFGDGLRYWQVWIIIVVGAWLMAAPLTFNSMSAGADWLQWGVRSSILYRKQRIGVINFYNITSISSSGAGATVYLRFEDSGGNVLFRMLHDLQKSRKIWDLFYNGVLHSVANGADIDYMATKALHLDETPALELRTDNDTTKGH